MPRHRVLRLRAVLEEAHREYAAQAIECHGTFFCKRDGHSTKLDTAAGPQKA